MDIDPRPVAEVRGSLLREREFGLLFWGQAVSVLGDRLVMVAMPFAVLSIPGAGLGSVGVVLGASALSLAVFVLIGGVWADRLPRHLTMLGSDLVRFVAQAGTATLLLTDHATVTRVALLQALYGAAEAFFRPAVLGLVPQVVLPAKVQAANAMLGLTNNVGMVAGPALAGLLVATTSAGGAIAFDAATFLVSGLALAQMRPTPFQRRAVAASFRAELTGGWREVRSRTGVWSVFGCFCAYHALVLPALFVLGPLVAVQDRGGAAAWGLITAGFGVGAVVGSLLSLRWRPPRPGVVIGLSLCLASTQSAIVVSTLPTLVVALLELLTGVCVAVTFTIWETALQQRIPADAQSRVSSFDYLGSLVLMPAGYLLIGPLAHTLGTRPAAVVTTATTAVVCLLVAGSPAVRRLAPLT